MSGFSQTADGLLVPRGAQEAAAAAALQRHDSDLRLVCPPESAPPELRFYRVIRRVRNEARPFETVCVYMDEAGRPLPLSVSGIVDMVQRLDRNTVGSVQDADELNMRLIAERRRDADRDFDEIEREFVPRIEGKKSAPLPRSRSLYLSRVKQRERIKSPEIRP